MNLSDDQKIFRLNLFLLFFLTLGVYSRSLLCGFVSLDDPIFVTKNHFVLGGLSIDNILWAFSSFYSGTWMPMTWISHMLDITLFGLRPWAHHLVSVLIHASSTLLLFSALFRMTSRLWPSLFTAALFAVHPTHVESVVWIAERKDVLSGFFWMITLLAYARYTEKRSVLNYILLILSFIFGLFSKPMVVTLPVILLLLDYWPLEQYQKGRHWKHLILEKIPLLLLSIALVAVTVISQADSGAVSSIEKIPVQVRLTHALVSAAAYLSKIVWPSNLSVFYPFTEDSLTSSKVISAAFLMMTVTILVLAFFKKRPVFAIGWFWFLISLVPVIGLVPIGSQFIADRYIYLPSIGIFMMLAYGCKPLSLLSKPSALVRRAAIFLITLCSIVTWQVIGYWRDSETLLSQALSATEKNSFIHSVYGRYWTEAGQPEKAIAHYEEAVRIRPLPETKNDLANAYFQNKDLSKAIELYQSLLQEYPEQAPTWYNLGLAYHKMGMTEKAAQSFQEAARNQYPPAITALAELKKNPKS